MRTLPGNLTSPTAGPILCPGAPVICTYADAGYRLPGEVTRAIVGRRYGDAWDVHAHEGWVSGGPVTLDLDLTADLGPTIALRWLGRHYGLTFGVGGPGWRYSEALLAWFLKGEGYNNDIGFASDAINMKPTDHAIPGISEIRDPLEALVAACVHAAGVSRMNGRTSLAAPDCIKARSPRYAIDRIVIHAQDGTQAGTEAWFRKPGRTPPTAAHYLIGRDGAVVQMVPDDRKAIHAGSPTEAGWNDRSIGLEFEVRCNPWKGRARFPLNDWTPAMLDAGAEVTAILCAKFWIPVNRVHIVGHSEIAGVTHVDPGDAFPWSTFMELVLAHQA